MKLEATLADIERKLREGRFPNEQSISQRIILRVLGDLNWDVYDTNTVYPEYLTGEGRVDFALCEPPSKPKIFVEVKQPGKVEDGVRQALEYAFHTGVPFIVPTGGKRWSFYLPAEQDNYEDRRVFKLDLFERSPRESADVLRRYLERSRVTSNEALESAREEYRDQSRRAIAQEAIPSAWKEIVDGGDEQLIELLADAVESRAGVRPTDDDVIDFLASLRDQTSGGSPLSERREKNTTGTTAEKAKGSPRQKFSRSVSLVILGERFEYRDAEAVVIVLKELHGID